MTKEVPLYLHRETGEVIVILNQDQPRTSPDHYAVKQGATPPTTLEEAAKKKEELIQIPTQPTSHLWPLNYPEQRPQEVPLK